MATIITMYWRDIPAQVIAKPDRSSGLKPIKKVLSQRFQTAIDEAAMLSNRTASDDYLAEWHRVKRPCTPEENDDLGLAVDQIVTSLENEFTDKGAAGRGTLPSRARSAAERIDDPHRARGDRK